VVSGLPDVLPVGSFFMSLSPWATPIAPPGFPSASRELEVRDLRGPDGPHKLEPVEIVPDAFEQTLAGAEERGHETDLHLVHEAGSEILLGGPRAAGVPPV
jgi:hypothetical protein